MALDPRTGQTRKSIYSLPGYNPQPISFPRPSPGAEWRGQQNRPFLPGGTARPGFNQTIRDPNMAYFPEYGMPQEQPVRRGLGSLRDLFGRGGRGNESAVIGGGLRLPDFQFPETGMPRPGLATGFGGGPGRDLYARGPVETPQRDILARGPNSRSARGDLGAALGEGATARQAGDLQGRPLAQFTQQSGATARSQGGITPASTLEDIYKNQLGRDIGDEGRTFYGEQLEAGRPLDEIRNEIMGSPEAQQYRSQEVPPASAPEGGITQGTTLEDIYKNQLGRDIGPEGREFYGQQLEDGRPIEEIRAEIMGSDEAQQYRSQGEPAVSGLSGIDPALMDIFKNQLGRDIGAEGERFYGQQLAEGRPIEEIRAEIEASPEARRYDMANVDPGIKDAFRTQFGREIGEEGAQWYMDQMAEGLSLEEALAQIESSPEALAYDLATVHPSIKQAYKDALGRDIGPEGARFYMDRMQEGLSLDEAIGQIRTSPEAEEYRTAQQVEPIYEEQLVTDIPPPQIQGPGDPEPGQPVEVAPQEPVWAPPTGLKGSEAATRGGLEASLDVLRRGRDQAREDITRSTEQGLGYLGDRYAEGTDFIERGAAGFDPFLSGGQQAAQRQAALSGALGPEAQEEAFANFRESPGQQFLRDQMEQASLRTAAATGFLGSGNLQMELQERAMGLAQTDYQNYFNRLGDVSGQGLQAAAGRGGMFGQGAALAGQQGQAGSALIANQGTQLANLAFGAGTGASALFQNAAQNVASGRYNAGLAISNAIGGTTSALSNLQDRLGQGGAAITGDAGNQLANLIMGMGNASAEDQNTLMTLLANLSAQQGTQLGQAQLGRGGKGTGATEGLFNQFVSFLEAQE